MRAKILDLPNGRRTNSDRIRRIEVDLGRSLSLQIMYLEIYEDEGLIYQGLVDLGRLAARGGQGAKSSQ